MVRCWIWDAEPALTELLAKEGYDMIGVDVSEDMLQEAIENEQNPGCQFCIYCRICANLNCTGTVRAVVSICDSLNYILDYKRSGARIFAGQQLSGSEGNVHFDPNTEAKFQAMGSETIAEVRDEGSFIWENEYDEEEKLTLRSDALYPRGG